MKKVARKIVIVVFFGFSFVSGMTIQDLLQDSRDTYFHLLPLELLTVYILPYNEMARQQMEAKFVNNPYGRQIWLDTAAGEGNCEEVKFLLNKGINENLRGPLYQAAFHGRTLVVALLLDRGAANEMSFKMAPTPLLAATEKSKYDIVGLLLKARADVNYQIDGDRTPLFIAARNGDERMVELLLNAGADREQDCNGETPLYIASSVGHIGVVRLLLSRGAFKEWTQEMTMEERELDYRPRKRTPLFIAASNGRADVVEELIRQGAYKDRLTAWGTPLYAAVKNGHREVVERLLQMGADPDKPNMDRSTPSSVTTDHEIRKLLEQYRKSKTSLCEALESCQVPIINSLLRAGVDINATSDGRTPLFIAIEYDRRGIVEWLISAGARCSSDDRAFAGSGALYCAAFFGNNFAVHKCLRCYSYQTEQGQEELIKAILIGAENGYMFTSFLENDVIIDMCKKLTIEKKWELLERAPAERLLWIVSAVIDEKASADSLFESKLASLCEAASLAAHTRSLYYAMTVACKEKGIHLPWESDLPVEYKLQRAASKGYSNVVKLLIDKIKKEKGEVGRDGELPLVMATMRGHGLVVDTLVSYGRVDPNIILPDGSALLHCAAFYGYVPVVRLLLGYGLDRNAYLPDGKTRAVEVARGQLDALERAKLSKPLTEVEDARLRYAEIILLLQ